MRSPKVTRNIQHTKEYRKYPKSESKMVSQSFDGAQCSTCQDPEKTLFIAHYLFHSLVSHSVRSYSLVCTRLLTKRNNTLFTQALAISNQNLKLLIFQMKHSREYSFYGISLQQLAYIFKAMDT